MYYDFTVPIPDVKGKITHMKKGDITYIQYETDRVYYPDRKYTIPKRVSIGKLDKKHAGLMFPNEKYAEYRKNKTPKVGYYDNIGRVDSSGEYRGF